MTACPARASAMNAFNELSSVEVRSEIARLEAEGYRPTAIARSLNARNIPTRRANQRRHTHLMRNYLNNVPKASQSMVATLVRTIFEVQPDPERVWAQHCHVVAPNETTGTTASESRASPPYRGRSQRACRRTQPAREMAPTVVDTRPPVADGYLAILVRTAWQ